MTQLLSSSVAPIFRRARLPLILACIASAMLVACRAATPSPSDVRFNVSVNPSPPEVGTPAAVIVELADAGGSPINDAAVKVRGDMSHAGMQPVEATAVSETNGRYVVSEFPFTMAGDWILTVEATLADGQTAEHRLDLKGVTGNMPGQHADGVASGITDNEYADAQARINGAVIMSTVRARSSRRFDVLTIPGIGQFLRWRHARTTLQIPMLLVAFLVLTDGFFGPQIAPQNLAGVLPWVHWRGLVVLALLLIGNVFCMACPFMLPRKIAKRFLPANRHWPSWLRTKWLAAALLILFFWAYEAFDLWASPWLTAWVAASYFVGALVVDGIFRGAAFCKYVCPIGQFNFVNSLQSPFEVAVRSVDTCAACTTKDCIAGRAAPATAQAAVATRQPMPLPVQPSTAGHGPSRARPVQVGCELWLFQERKVGNMDCTFCLDCIHACPHDNVGILSRMPLLDLVQTDRRSGIGRFAERPDLAALVLVIVFGAFLNAFGMVSPVYALGAWLAAFLGTESEAVVVGVIMLAGVVIAPIVLVGLTALVSRTLSRSHRPLVEFATVFSFSLAPVGFGMWLAHYSFHFFVSALAIVPLFQSYLADLGLPVLGAPRWDFAAVLPVSWISSLESIFLLLGLAGSLLAADRIARAQVRGTRRARSAFLPWAALIVALFLAGVWLMGQPMEMRGLLA